MFKHFKLKDIVRLYNKIKEDFNVEKVYVNNIFHPMDVNYFLTQNVSIKILVGNHINRIEFSWFDKVEECNKSTFIDDNSANNDLILDSIRNALSSVYRDYKVINEEVTTLLSKVSTNVLTTQILVDILNQRVKNF